MKEFIFTWSIENISYSWHKTGEYIVSPTFIAGPMKNSAWSLKLYPGGRDNSDFLSLYLSREKDNVSRSIAVNFEFSCITADSSKLFLCFILEAFKTFANSGYIGCGESCFIKRHEVFDRRKDFYLPNDILTLQCRMWKRTEDVDETGRSFGRTRLKINRLLSVENISPTSAVIQKVFIKSKCQNENLISVGVWFYKDRLSIKFTPIKTNQMKSTTLKLAFVDKRNDKLLCEHLTFWFGEPHMQLLRLPFLDILSYTKSDRLNVSDFEFKVECVYSTGEVFKVIEEDCPLRTLDFVSNFIDRTGTSEKLINGASVIECFWNLYTEQVLCDVELKTRNKSFAAHKIVLCARSPVFLTMLTGEVKGEISDSIEIKDIKDGTLEIFLKFLYTDVSDDLDWNSVVDLYPAAVKYQVQRLKFFCCSYFLKYIKVENICDVLMLADRYQDTVLMRKVEDFIWMSKQEIFKSSIWQKFAHEHQDLAIKTMLSEYEEKEKQSFSEVYADKTSNYPKFLEDLKSLYQSQIICDIGIKTTCTTFPAHKIVLSAMSSKFREIFTTDLKDGPADFFEVKDLDDDTVSRMLLFLYTDSLDDVQWDITMKLYHAADVYQIQRLKFKCSCSLLENLRVSNVGDLLLLAHEHNDNTLKSVVEDYICIYDEEIFNSDKWATFSEANFRLAFETMLLKYKRDKKFLVSNPY